MSSRTRLARRCQAHSETRRLLRPRQLGRQASPHCRRSATTPLRLHLPSRRSNPRPHPRIAPPRRSQTPQARQTVHTRRTRLPPAMPRHSTRRPRPHPRRPRRRARRPRPGHTARKARPVPRYEHANHRSQDANPLILAYRHSLGEVLEPPPREATRT